MTERRRERFWSLRGLWFWNFGWQLPFRRLEWRIKRRLRWREQRRLEQEARAMLYPSVSVEEFAAWFCGRPADFGPADD